MVSASTHARRAAVIVGALLGAGHAVAATIYGALSEGGQAVVGAPLELKCGADASAVKTDARGAYRFTVNQTGKCELHVAGAMAPIILYNEPTRYDYEIRRAGGTTTLVRR
jgi:hypothetical protein